MIEIYLFGGICVTEEGSWGPHPILSRPKCAALLAFLAAARPRGCHRRDKLLALFWPESNESRARGALRKTLFCIRQELGERVLCGCGCEDVGVNFDEVWCDAVAFREAAAAGDLEEALGRYAGDFLDGVHLGEWAFDQWVDEERREYRARAASSGWALSSEEEGRGRTMEAARWARRAAGLTPFDEMAHQRLLRTLDRLGDRSGALREHGQFVRRLEGELDLSPSPETEHIVGEIRGRSQARTADPHGSPIAPAGSRRNGSPAAYGNGNGRLAPSIAVLPFSSLTDDPESRQFADGLHQEVIAQLRGSGVLRVVPRATVLAHRERPDDPQAVAEALDVETVLEGSVRSWNGRVRISFDLVPKTGRESLWARVFERELEDQLALQVRLAREVAQGLSEGLVAP